MWLQDQKSCIFFSIIFTASLRSFLLLFSAKLGLFRLEGSVSELKVIPIFLALDSSSGNKETRNYKAATKH